VIARAIRLNNFKLFKWKTGLRDSLAPQHVGFSTDSLLRKKKVIPAAKTALTFAVPCSPKGSLS
jgi:hypothetical protein